MSTQSHKRLPLYATPPSTLLEGLRRVLEIIETGYTKFLIGACYRAGFGSFDMRYAVFEAIAAQLPESFEPGHSITWRLLEWNHAPKRTQSEVLALIDKAIEVENRKQ